MQCKAKKKVYVNFPLLFELKVLGSCMRKCHLSQDSSFQGKLTFAFPKTSITSILKQTLRRKIYTFFTHHNFTFFFFRCWSSVGKKYWRTNYGQEVSLGKHCNHKGTIMHEIMHAIGFWHEQSRPDRNQYVEVLWENVLPGNVILGLLHSWKRIP